MGGLWVRAQLLGLLGVGACGYIDYEWMDVPEPEAQASSGLEGAPSTITPTAAADTPSPEASSDTVAPSVPPTPGAPAVNLLLSPSSGTLDLALGVSDAPAGYTLSVRRALVDAPASLGEGDVVCDDCSESFSEAGLDNGVTYAYTAFLRDADGIVVATSTAAEAPRGTWGLTTYQQAYMKASHPTGLDYFAAQIDLSGDGRTLVASSQLEDSSATGINGDASLNDSTSVGAAFVYARVGLSWSQEAYIKASNAEANDRFGASVSVSTDGNVLAIGAPREASLATGVGGDGSLNNGSNVGAVYLYERVGGVWSESAYIKASNAENDDYFGTRLALSGDGNTLAVASVSEGSSAQGIGGNQSLNDAPGSGAVYIFSRSGGSWSQVAYVKASNAEAGDGFGMRLALSEDGRTLVVTSQNEASDATGVGGDASSNVAPNAGAAYVFAESGGVWSEQAYLKASNAEANDRFGFGMSLAADGNTVAVGAAQEDSDALGIDGDGSLNGANASGAVYVFRRSGSLWSQEAYVKASNTDSGDRFGRSVSLSASGDTLAVGAYYEASGDPGVGGDPSLNNLTQSGAAYVLTRDGSSWSHAAYMKSTNVEAYDLFGEVVSLSGDGAWLAVGVSFEDSSDGGVGANDALNGATNSGAAYVFAR